MRCTDHRSNKNPKKKIKTRPTTLPCLALTKYLSQWKSLGLPQLHHLKSSRVFYGSRAEQNQLQWAGPKTVCGLRPEKHFGPHARRRSRAGRSQSAEEFLLFDSGVTGSWRLAEFWKCAARVGLKLLAAHAHPARWPQCPPVHRPFIMDGWPCECLS